MSPDEHEHVAQELEALIRDTQETINRFDATGMDEKMPEDYDKLLAILDNAIKQQREQIRLMLKE